MQLRLKKDSNIIYELTRKQIKTQYRDSTLGFIWTILNPLLTMLVMWLVFSTIFGHDDPYYPIYLLCGNVLFTAVKNSTTQSLQSSVANRGLLLRTKIEPYVFPFSYNLSSIVNFAFSLIALIPFMIWKSVELGVNLFSYHLAFVFLMLPAFFLFELGFGLFLSVIYVFFRDTKHIYTVFLVLWTYLTPIFYKPTIIAQKAPAAYTIIKLNPMYHFIKYFRECIYAGAAGRDLVLDEFIGSSFLPTWGTLGWCYLSAVAFFILGYIVYKCCKDKVILKI